MALACSIKVTTDREKRKGFQLSRSVPSFRTFDGARLFAAKESASWQTLNISSSRTGLLFFRALFGTVLHTFRFGRYKMGLFVKRLDLTRPGFSTSGMQQGNKNLTRPTNLHLLFPALENSAFTDRSVDEPAKPPGLELPCRAFLPVF